MINIWATSWENLFMPYANNKGTDQPVHSHSDQHLCCSLPIDSIMSLISILAISCPKLGSIAEQAGLNLTWSQTPKKRFSRDETHTHSWLSVMDSSTLANWVPWTATLKPTKWNVRPAKTQISLGICPVWSEFSLSPWRKLGSLATQWAHSEDSDQTGRMPRLIWVFAGGTVILLRLAWGGSIFVTVVQGLHCLQRNNNGMQGSNGLMDAENISNMVQLIILAIQPKTLFSYPAYDRVRLHFTGFRFCHIKCQMCKNKFFHEETWNKS